jgi:hypothetical protein
VRPIGPRFSSGTVGVLALLAALLAWLWPIGIGGKMPVGGDVTQFFIGLMGFLGESLRAGRLPVWNDLWGYGFPGLAESQMGVFYPIHLVLYRFLDAETAYVVSLVFHTLWGGLGTFWAARRMSISSAGSALAAFAWSTCGFFVVHLAHQWGYTTGCWMPWAWGLTWCCLSAAGAFRTVAPFVLSLVLFLQILPGHFQLAFETQVGIGLILIWAAVERVSGRLPGRRPASSAPAGFKMAGASSVVLAVAGVFPLAAIQLWPTARLAGLTDPRDFEYLSGFASTPFHLVNYVAPGLFHRSPLWRPLVWDPFHAMPEEHMAYIGLVPLFLACVAMVREWRRDAVVRLLIVLAVGTLILSMGPYMPGFRYLIHVPGFSFFRAASRWSLATALALALLAGKGFDRWPEWARPVRSLRRFVFGAAFWVLVIVGLVELALWCTSSPGRPTLIRGFQRVFDAMPWQGDLALPLKREPTFDAVMAGARGPAPDPRIPAVLNRSVFLQKDANSGSFVTQRWMIYALELGEAAALLAVLWLIARLSDKGRIDLARTRWLLVALTVLDLWILGRHRLLDLGPLKPLAQQSPVLARLAREPRGTRIADDRIKNMPMLVGLAPISAYRTLDLPVVPELTSLALGSLSSPTGAPLVESALRATGTGIRPFDPVENRKNHILQHDGDRRETIDDPALASWIYGKSWVTDQGSWARAFTIWHSENRPIRAWFIPLDMLSDEGSLDDSTGDPRDILAILHDAQPLAAEMPEPEEWTIGVASEDPGFVIVSQLADPQWTARWFGLDGQGEVAGTILPTFRTKSHQGAAPVEVLPMIAPDGWQRIPIPASGRWTLRLEYEARDLAEGAAISSVAWLSWIMAALATAIKSGRGRSRPRQDETEA